MQSPLEDSKVNDQLSASDTYLLSIPSTKLCVDCSHLKTIAKIIHQAETHKEEELLAFENLKENEEKSTEIKSTAVFEYPKESGPIQENILTVSQRLSAMSTIPEEEIESIESLEQSLTIKKQSSNLIESARTDESMLKEKVIMEKVKEKKLLYEQYRRSTEKKGTDMIISLTDLDMFHERNLQQQNVVVWKQYNSVSDFNFLGIPHS